MSDPKPSAGQPQAVDRPIPPIAAPPAAPETGPAAIDKVLDLLLNRPAVQALTNKPLGNFGDEPLAPVFCVLSDAPSPDLQWPPCGYAEMRSLAEQDDADEHAFYISTALVVLGVFGRVRNRKSHAGALLAVFLDDVGTKAMPSQLIPTYVIESSAGNFQHWYVFETPLTDLELADRLVRTVYAEEALGDAHGRLMTKFGRLPCGWNGKGRNGSGRDTFQVRLTGWNPDKLYTVSQLMRAWGLKLAEPKSVPPSAAYQGDGDAHPVIQAMRDCGYAGGNQLQPYEAGFKLRLDACVWADEHETGGPDGAVVFLDGNGFRYDCAHAGCKTAADRKERTPLALLHKLRDEHGLDPAELDPDGKARVRGGDVDAMFGDVDLGMLAPIEPTPEPTLEERLQSCLEAEGEELLTLAKMELRADQNDQILDGLVQAKIGKKRALAKGLAQLQSHVQKVRGTAAFEAQAAGRVLIELEVDDLNGMVQKVYQSFTDGRPGWEIVRANDILSRVDVRQIPGTHGIDSQDAVPPAVPTLAHFTRPMMLLRIDQSARFYIPGSKGPTPKPIPPELPQIIIESPDLDFPRVRGLVTHPVVKADGRIVRTEGYDPVTELYFAFGGARFAHERMTPEEGYRVLVEEAFGEFEFEDEVAKVCAVALLLTALQRKVLHDAPLFLITAAVQGTGKTTLARVIHVLLSGHDMPVMTLSADPVEAKKAFFSALLNSPELICFDNIADGTTLRHPVLGAATTSSILKDRVLGLSKDAVVPLNVPIVVTGNNISLDQDFLRRFLEVRLTSKSARPETRAFKHAAVVQHVRRNRDRWTAAALSVLMGDGAALPAASGFPSWDQGVRSKLLAVAKVDPVDSWNRIRSNSEDLSRMQAYMAGLADWKPNDEEFTVRELAAAIAEGIRNSFATMPLLAKAFAEYPPRSGGEWNVNRLRWVMKMLTERPVAGFQLQVRTLDGYSRYSVTKFSEET